MKAIAKALCLVLVLGFGIASAAFADTLKDEIAVELGFIKRVFETGYAPTLWKKEHLGWDLQTEYQKQMTTLDGKAEVTALDYRRMISGLLGSAHDYHVSCGFFATESSTLPFTVSSAEGHVYVVYVNTDKLSTDILAPGDEILMWNDKPVADEINTVLAQHSYGVPTTDQRLAELLLTKRMASMSFEVPQGFVTLTYKHGGQTVSHQLPWEYAPETVAWNETDNFMRSFMPMSQVGIEKSGNDYMHLQMSWGLWKTYSKFEEDAPAAPVAPPNPFKIGGQKTFVPELGQVIWHSSDTDYFNAYIYRNEAGKLIGYLRIKDYDGSNERFAEFKKTVQHMEQSTDALVIDEVNNPGGSVFYVYAMMSVLSPNPIKVPDHHITLWPEQVKASVDEIPLLTSVKNDADAQKLFGEKLDGFPMDYQFAQSVLNYDRTIVSNWQSKVKLTAPLFLWGVDKVNPDKDVNYTKPILVLINELDFSGGDFFPAILQDNQRAKIFGARTSGAGGYILEVKFPSALGLEAFSFTGSLARRIGGQPIENLGVIPDVPYTFTSKDMTGGFSDYKDAVNKTIQGML